MRTPASRAISLLNHRFSLAVRDLRDKVNHLEIVVEGLQAELHRERDERIEQMDLVTRILGNLAADLEHRAAQAGDYSETRAAFGSLLKAVEEAERGRL